MDARESDLAIKVIGRMAQTDELRCQQLQEAWAKNERLEKENETLRWDFNEAMRQYNAQQKRACDAEAERDQARAWAKAWKLAAKSHRSVSLWRRDHLHRLERIVSDG